MSIRELFAQAEVKSAADCLSYSGRLMLRLSKIIIFCTH